LNFRKPLLIPARAELTWGEAGYGWNFLLTDHTGQRPFMDGSLS
jgi:hypothetical protein